MELVRSAQAEARLRGDRRVGTEHLLLGLLHDTGAPPARALGVDLPTARAALVTLDHAALTALGLDLADPPAGRNTPQPTAPATAKRRLAPWTSGARTALGASVRATTARTRHHAPSHLLLALLDRDRPDPAADLIDALEIDRHTVRARIAATLSA